MPSSAYATPATCSLSLHDALPICGEVLKYILDSADIDTTTLTLPTIYNDELENPIQEMKTKIADWADAFLRPSLWHVAYDPSGSLRSEEHTSELQSPCNLVCRLLPTRPPRRAPFPYTTLFRSAGRCSSTSSTLRISTRRR